MLFLFLISAGLKNILETYERFNYHILKGGPRRAESQDRAERYVASARDTSLHASSSGEACQQGRKSGAADKCVA